MFSVHSWYELRQIESAFIFLGIFLSIHAACVDSHSFEYFEYSPRIQISGGKKHWKVYLS